MIAAIITNNNNAIITYKLSVMNYDLFRYSKVIFAEVEL